MWIRRSHHFIKSGRVYLLACLFIFIAGVAQAQTDSEKKDALELKLSAPNTTLCVGTSIDLELEIKNISQEVVKIDKADLWDSYYFFHSNADGSKQMRGQTSRHLDEGPYYGDFMVLYPGETYWGTHKVLLENEFLRKAVKYSMDTLIEAYRSKSIDTIYSNEVDFELIDCGNK